MEIRSAYTIPRMPEERRGHIRIHDATIMHWVAVVILVIGQFTVIPMLSIIAADSHRPPIQVISSNDGHSDANTTTAFKTPTTLNP